MGRAEILCGHSPADSQVPFYRMVLPGQFFGFARESSTPITPRVSLAVGLSAMLASFFSVSRCFSFDFASGHSGDLRNEDMSRSWMGQSSYRSRDSSGLGVASRIGRRRKIGALGVPVLDFANKEPLSL